MGVATSFKPKGSLYMVKPTFTPTHTSFRVVHSAMTNAQATDFGNRMSSLIRLLIIPLVNGEFKGIPFPRPFGVDVTPTGAPSYLWGKRHIYVAIPVDSNNRRICSS